MAEQTVHAAIKPMSSQRYFERFAWALLGYTLLVILWGVYVRATGSGAGCGGHWPTCNGMIIPQSPQMNTLIEFTHRVSSGVTLLLSIVIAVWAWRAFAKGHPVRLFSFLVLVFTLTEAIIGAGLVLFGLVASNSSVARAVTVSLHLVNTLLLLGSLSLAAWYAWMENRNVSLQPIFPPAQRGRWIGLLVIALVGMGLLSITGTITALGDTLFPAGTLAEGLKQDISPLSSFLIRLRVIHPVLAVIFVSYSAILVYKIRPKILSREGHLLSTILLMLFIWQLVLGMTNIILLAPVWLQLVHLLTADLVWIILVLFSVNVIQPRFSGLNPPEIS